MGMGISKKISYILRHNPSSINIDMDKHGYVAVDELISKLDIRFDQLKAIVDTNNKKRFSFNKDLSKIRASQGHSIKVNMGLEPIKPPLILYHGTSIENKKAILENGILKMNRNHVHLSADTETALTVGSRHGKPYIFKIYAFVMCQDGFDFYISENDVWLTNYVPPKYLIWYGKNFKD